MSLYNPWKIPDFHRVMQYPASPNEERPTTKEVWLNTAASMYLAFAKAFPDFEWVSTKRFEFPTDGDREKIAQFRAELESCESERIKKLPVEKMVFSTRGVFGIEFRVMARKLFNDIDNLSDEQVKAKLYGALYNATLKYKGFFPTVHVTYDDGVRSVFITLGSDDPRLKNDFPKPEVAKLALPQSNPQATSLVQSGSKAEVKSKEAEEERVREEERRYAAEKAVRKYAAERAERKEAAEKEASKIAILEAIREHLSEMGVDGVIEEGALVLSDNPDKEFVEQIVSSGYPKRKFTYQKSGNNLVVTLSAPENNKDVPRLNLSKLVSDAKSDLLGQQRPANPSPASDSDDEDYFVVNDQEPSTFKSFGDIRGFQSSNGPVGPSAKDAAAASAAAPVRPSAAAASAAAAPVKNSSNDELRETLKLFQTKIEPQFAQLGIPVEIAISETDPVKMSISKCHVDISSEIVRTTWLTMKCSQRPNMQNVGESGLVITFLEKSAQKPLNVQKGDDRSREEYPVPAKKPVALPQSQQQKPQQKQQPQSQQQQQQQAKVEKEEKMSHDATAQKLVTAQSTLSGMGFNCEIKGNSLVFTGQASSQDLVEAVIRQAHPGFVFHFGTQDKDLFARMKVEEPARLPDLPLVRAGKDQMQRSGRPQVKHRPRPPAIDAIAGSEVKSFQVNLNNIPADALKELAAISTRISEGGLPCMEETPSSFRVLCNISPEWKEVIENAIEESSMAECFKLSIDNDDFIVSYVKTTSPAAAVDKQIDAVLRKFVGSGK